MSDLVRRTAGFCVCCALLLPFLSAHAQQQYWEPEEGVMVRQANHFTWIGDGVANDGEEYWCAAWSDGKSGAQNIYVQLYDSNNQEQWEAGGLQITNLPTPQQQPLVVYAGDGNWLVAWEDYRGYPHDSRADFAIQKISSNGQLQWTDNGVLLSQEPEVESVLCSLNPLPDHTTLVFWKDDHTGLVQKLDSNGNPLWEEGGIVLQDSCRFIHPAVLEDGSFTVAFGTAVSLQHFDSSGNPVWNEGAPIDLDEYSNDIRIITDHQENVFVTWLDYDRRCIYGQYVSVDGALLWDEPVNLTGHCNYIYNDDMYRIMHHHDGTCILAWSVMGDSTIRELRMRFFDAVSNENPDPEEVQGTVLFPDETLTYRCIRLSHDDEGGFILTTSDAAGKGRGSEIFVMRFDENGDYAWNDGVPGKIEIDGLPCWLSFASFIQDDQVRVFWPDIYTEGNNFACVQFSAFDAENGNELFEEPFPLVTGMIGDGKESKIVCSNNNVFILWHDYRDYHDLYAQRLDFDTGEPLLEQNGVLLEPGDPARGAVDLDRVYPVPDNEGGMVLLSSMVNGMGRTLNLDRYNANLERVWENSILITPDEYALPDGTSNPYQLFQTGPNGHYYMVWESYSGAITCNCVDDSGNLLWGDAGVTASGQNCILRSMTVLENGELVIMYTLGEDVYMTLLDSNGVPAWESQIVNGNMRTCIASHVIPRSNDILVLWTHLNDNTQLLGQSVSMDGEAQWEISGRIIMDIREAKVWLEEAEVVLNDDDSFWLTWYDYPEEYNRNVIFCQLFDSEGEPSLEPEGGIVLPGQTQESVISFSDSKIVTDGQNGIYILYTVHNHHVCSDPDLGYSHMDAHGNFTGEIFEQGDAYLSEMHFTQCELAVTSDGEGGVLASWTDFRGQPVDDPVDDIYAMRITNDPFHVDGNAENLHPVSWELHGAYPNPFNPSTTLSFTAPRTSEVTLAVYDVLGRKVATLVDGVVQAGRQQVIWQGHSDKGMPVASGTYFVKLSGNSVHLTEKIVLLK